jgi:hypothetical protein
LNFFFANDGAGKFQDIAAEVGLLDDSQTGRGTAILDSNGDGLLDIVYGNWNGPHRLFVQEKDANNCPKFVDKASAEMATASPIRTVIPADFDNDGYEEIFWNNIPGANRLFRELPTDSDWTQVKLAMHSRRMDMGLELLSGILMAMVSLNWLWHMANRPRSH